MSIWLLPLSYYERCCHEHLCISFCVDVCFSPLEYIIRSTAAGSYNNSVFNILRNYFPKCLYHFYPPGAREGSSFNTSLISVIFCLQPFWSFPSQNVPGIPWHTGKHKRLQCPLLPQAVWEDLLREALPISLFATSAPTILRPAPCSSSSLFSPVVISVWHTVFDVDHCPPPTLEYRPCHPQQCGPEEPRICLLHNESK